MIKMVILEKLKTFKAVKTFKKKTFSHVVNVKSESEHFREIITIQVLVTEIFRSRFSSVSSIL